jgi:hypothetical protein
MKIVSLLVLVFAPFLIEAQSTVRYEAKSVYSYYFAPKTSEVLSRKPAGKDVEIVHDTFFKSWVIRYIDENGEEKPFKLMYLSKNKDGRGDLMYDAFNNQYALVNKIDEDKSIFINFMKPLDNGITVGLEIVEINKISK